MEHFTAKSLFLQTKKMDSAVETILETVLTHITDPLQTSVLIENVETELAKIDGDLELLELGLLCQRNKTRKKRRLLAKKEKMRVKLNLAMRDVYEEILSPNERRALQYLSRKYENTEEESDESFLYRVLCTDLELTMEDWEPYLPK